MQRQPGRGELQNFITIKSIQTKGVLNAAGKEIQKVVEVKTGITEKHF